MASLSAAAGAAAAAPPPSHNLATAPYPSEACLQDLFWAQARATPDAVALEDPAEAVSMTYRELDALTDRLAAELFHAHGVRPNSVVGIFMERSAEYVIAYVAVLKAGGAYMPLELVYPRGLLQRAIAQTQCAVVLTKSRHADRLPREEDRSGAAVLRLDDVRAGVGIPRTPADLTGGAASMPARGGGFSPRPTPDDLAFVVMSSGTTGLPKGICQVHRSAVHSYHDRFTRFPYHVDAATGAVQDRVGAGVFFVWELMRPLLRGATCTVIPDDVIFDPRACAAFVRAHRVTRILFTPSLLQLITDTLTPAEISRSLAGLRMCWLCGEVVTTDLATKFTAMLPDCELLNLYSISECHDATIGDLRRDLDPSRQYATCGKNIPNVRVYVVEVEENPDDPSGHTPTLRQVAPGEAGEVFVGGPVLAQGYLAMPEKTASRFVRDPFAAAAAAGAPESRLYRTGDMGRVLPKTGELEIIGRCDFMVKIRGYSVVLGAVETALAKHPQLASAVVITEGAEGTDKKVVAYVVPLTWDNPPSAANVRLFLKDHLPPYAVPSVFCVIDSLPVAATAAGKIDRKKLPKSEAAQTLPAFVDVDPAALRRVPPQGPTETLVLRVVSELVAAPEEDLSANDSFFDVGGHSLLATRLVARLVAELGCGQLALGDIVAGPSVQEIAARVDALLASPGGAGRGDGGGCDIDFSAEAEALDPSIYPAATRKAKRVARVRLEQILLRPCTVFLTGATGWLGAHVLAQALERCPDMTIVCLVRAADEGAAWTRVVNTLTAHRLYAGVLSAMRDGDEDGDAGEGEEEEELKTRMRVVCGDLSKPLLGVPGATFKELAGEIDSIIHCGAAVNLVTPYAALKAPNVLGTQEVLRLAVTNGQFNTKVKPVHYISTNGIFPIAPEAWSDAGAGVVCEEAADIGGLVQHIEEGYGRSKWVAERMCNIAEGRGVPISVLRPGNMAGSSVTGAQNGSDFVFLFLSGCIALGMCPAKDMGDRYAFDLTPVDFAAAAVVRLALEEPRGAIGRRIHLQNPRAPVRLTQVCAALAEAGHRLKTDVTRAEWLAGLRAACDAERAQGRNTSVLQRLEAGFASFEVYFLASAWLTYGTSALEAALEGSGLECPAVSAALLGKWFPVAYP